MEKTFRTTRIRNAIGCGLLLASGATFSGFAVASPVECEGGADSAICRVDMQNGLTLETTVGTMANIGENRYEIWGNVQVVAGSTRFPLNDANIVVQLGDSPELYGESEVPLSQMPLLQDIDFETTPRAVLGIVSGASLPELTGNDKLPLNDSVSESGTLRDDRKPYFLFHLDAGVSFKLDFGEDLKALKEVAFTIPGSLTATAILDVFDPYFYLSYSRTEGIDLNSLKRKNPDDSSGLIVYEIMDENNEHVAMTFTLDPDTGVMEERNFVADTRIYYERNADGDYVQQNVQSNPIVLAGSQFDGTNRKEDKKQDDSSGGDFIDAIGFSTNGWIPYEAASQGSLPDDVADFAGQLFLHGEIPLSPAVSIDGDVVTYIGDKGVAQGGNGEVSIGIPGLPGFIDFDIHLGNASAAQMITEEKQLVFVDGELDPDTAFLEDILPIMPTGRATAQGYIGNDLESTQLMIEGEMGLGADLLGDLIGVSMNELQMTRASMSIDANGVQISGSTTMQISPDIRANSEIAVYAAFDWNNPEDVLLRLSGNMDLFGVALEDVTLQVSSRGMFVNGAFVTPVSLIALNGSITNQGPQMSGLGQITLDLGDIADAMEDATATLTAAQDEVNKINTAISAMRTIITEERQQDQKKLAEAQAAVTTAQNSVNRINSSINSHYRSINTHKARIASKYRWYKAAKWHQKASRYASYAAEKSWRSADIARRHVTIGTLKASKAIAIVALDAAKLVLQGVSQGLVLTPIDLDPRLAALFVARDSASLALDIAKEPFKLIPPIDASIEGQIEMEFGVNGIGGTVSASVDGFSVLTGELVFVPHLSACIAVPTFGNACTRL
ncbi:MAG: hypothetical protein AB8B63_09835 [Granulosicoccus sp.]